MELTTTLPTVLVIVGPTASGKSSLALHIARLTQSEIVSADSRQVYKLLNIGSAKPSQEVLNEVPHHFIDRLMPDEHFSAGIFGERGRIVIRSEEHTSELQSQR